MALDGDLPVLEAYDDARDVMFLKPPAHVAVLPMRPGGFAVFYPHDVHGLAGFEGQAEGGPPTAGRGCHEKDRTVGGIGPDPRSITTG